MLDLLLECVLLLKIVVIVIMLIPEVVIRISTAMTCDHCPAAVQSHTLLHLPLHVLQERGIEGKASRVPRRENEVYRPHCFAWVRRHMEHLSDTARDSLVDHFFTHKLPSRSLALLELGAV